MDWRLHGLGRRWHFALFHTLIRVGGRRPAYLLADAVTLAYLAGSPALRRRCRPYLVRRFPGRGPWKRAGAAWGMLRAFARTLIDQTAVALRGPGEIHTRFLGRDELQALHAEGRGLVILTAHVGAWQLAMANLATLGSPATVVAQAEPGDPTSPFHAGQAPFRLLDPRTYLGGVPDMMATLQRGDVLCIMGDRMPEGATSQVRVPFLGSPAPFPTLPFRLASATGAPVVILFSWKPDPHTYELVLADVLRIPPGLGRRPSACESHARTFARALEGFVDQHPHAFFNFFDLWEDAAPLAPPRRIR